MTLIAAILPSTVCCVEQLGALTGSLLPAEDRALGPGAGLKRRQDFTAGRTCARAALSALGIENTPVLIGAAREPVWPASVVGSITHCAGYCAVVVADAGTLKAIGVDAEPNEPLPDGVLSLIAVQEELAWLKNAPDSHVQWDRLLFSIKESTYKVLSPLTGEWFDFADACVHIDPLSSTFAVTMQGARAGSLQADLKHLRGRYLHHDQLLLTAIALSR